MDPIPILSKKAQKKGILYVPPNESSKTTIVLGKSKSGKTHFIVDELNKLANESRLVDGIIRPIFDKIIIFSESLNAEPFARLNKSLPIIFVRSYIPKLALLLKKLNDVSANKFRWLVILDDCVGSNTGKSLRGGAFPKMMLTFRNAGISTCVLVQGCTLLEPKSRENAHQIVITGLKIRDEVRAVNELLYDEVRKLFPDTKLKGERLAKLYFSLVGNDILFYDNLDNKAYKIERPNFNKK